MGFIEGVKSGYVNCFNITGRASQSEYYIFILWITCLFILPVGVEAASFYFVPQTDFDAQIQVLNLAFGLMWAIAAHVIPFLTLQVRRVHDAGYSRGWVLAMILLWGAAVAVNIVWPGAGTPSLRLAAVLGAMGATVVTAGLSKLPTRSST
jgi:uncharacterized membrane protein YhaH (DUF805 family)